MLLGRHAEAVPILTQAVQTIRGASKRSARLRGSPTGRR
jgi:hypothetical protein